MSKYAKMKKFSYGRTGNLRIYETVSENIATHPPVHLWCPSVNRLRSIYNDVCEGDQDECFPERLLDVLRITYHVSEEDRARIPRHGPVIVSANHPFGTKTSAPFQEQGTEGPGSRSRRRVAGRYPGTLRDGIGRCPWPDAHEMNPSAVTRPVLFL